MSFADMLMSGPKLVTKLDGRKAHSTKEFRIEILKKCLPGTVVEIARQSGYDLNQVRDDLNELARNGELVRERKMTKSKGGCPYIFKLKV